MLSLLASRDFEKLQRAIAYGFAAKLAELRVELKARHFLESPPQMRLGVAVAASLYEQANREEHKPLIGTVVLEYP